MRREIRWEFSIFAFIYRCFNWDIDVFPTFRNSKTFEFVDQNTKSNEFKMWFVSVARAFAGTNLNKDIEIWDYAASPFSLITNGEIKRSKLRKIKRDYLFKFLDWAVENSENLPPMPPEIKIRYNF